MKFLTPKELAEANDKSILVLDIRDMDSFNKNHIEGSANIDVYSDIHNGDYGLVKKKLDKLPKDKKIVVVCNAGVTAQPACEILESSGYKAIVLENGMIGWNHFSANKSKPSSNH